MKQTILVMLALTGLIAGCDSPPQQNKSGVQGGSERDPVVYIADDDQDMKQAIADARARLPEFWAHYDSPMNEEDFSLKVEINDANGTEFFWALPIERRDGKIYGTINNDPGIVKSVKFGETVEIPPDKIADWMYLKDGKIHGNFTMRPLLKQMSPEEAEQYRAMLAEP